MKKVFYKIHDPNTGLFSCGGANPTWSKYGKIWQTLAHLNLHIANLNEEGLTQYAQRRAELITLTANTTNFAPLQYHLEYIKQQKRTHL